MLARLPALANFLWMLASWIRCFYNRALETDRECFGISAAGWWLVPDTYMWFQFVELEIETRPLEIETKEGS